MTPQEFITWLRGYKAGAIREGDITEGEVNDHPIFKKLLEVQDEVPDFVNDPNTFRVPDYPTYPGWPDVTRRPWWEYYLYQITCNPSSATFNGDLKVNSTLTANNIIETQYNAPNTTNG